MADKEVEIEVLRAQAGNADQAGLDFGSSRDRVHTVSGVLSGDVWGRDPSAVAVRDMLLSTLANRVAELHQLMAAADKITKGLHATANAEERTERSNTSLFRRPIA